MTHQDSPYSDDQMITRHTGIQTTVENKPVTRRLVFALAWPIILSNLSTPLLGLVDTAVIGRLGDAVLIGAVAIGSMIFSFLFWGFGFLRMGTTGLVAQAYGAGDTVEIKASFYRAGLTGFLIGLLLIFIQTPMIEAAMQLISASQETETAALAYFQIRIWGAPFNLSLLAIMGYLLGIQQSRQLLIIQVTLNSLNIVLDIVFVVFLDWGVPGVAMATVVAEIMALGLGIMLVHGSLKSFISAPAGWAEILNIPAIKRMASVNRDIMLRTLCLIFAFAWFTNQGASTGDVTLAANAILMQFVTFAAFFLDGFALAAESLIGMATGSFNTGRLRRAMRYSFELAFATAAGLALCFFYAGNHVITWLTTAQSVITAAETYLVWVIAAPLLSVACYLLDGIFIGATRTLEMRNAMMVSLTGYLLAWYLLTPVWQNHGLWASLMIFFVLRALTLWYYYPRLFSRQ